MDSHGLVLVNVTVNITSTEPAPAEDRASKKLYFKFTEVSCKVVSRVLICKVKALSTD